MSYRQKVLAIVKLVFGREMGPKFQHLACFNRCIISEILRFINRLLCEFVNFCSFCHADTAICLKAESKLSPLLVENEELETHRKYSPTTHQRFENYSKETR